jgi:hypothetical protein
MASPQEPPFWPNVVTWGMVVVGWLLVHLATLNRDRRKERRDVAKAVVEEITDLEKSAREFHVSETFDGHKAQILRCETERVIRKIQRMPLSLLDIPLSRLVRLRKAITLKNTDRSDFKTQSDDSEILADIRMAVDDLLEIIEVHKDAKWE